MEPSPPEQDAVFQHPPFPALIQQSGSLGLQWLIRTFLPGGQRDLQHILPGICGGIPPVATLRDQRPQEMPAQGAELERTGKAQGCVRPGSACTQRSPQILLDTIPNPTPPKRRCPHPINPPDLRFPPQNPLLSAQTLLLFFSSFPCNTLIFLPSCLSPKLTPFPSFSFPLSPLFSPFPPFYPFSPIFTWFCRSPSLLSPFPSLCPPSFLPLPPHPGRRHLAARRSGHAPSRPKGAGRPGSGSGHARKWARWRWR